MGRATVAMIWFIASLCAVSAYVDDRTDALALGAFAAGFMTCLLLKEDWGDWRDWLF